MNVSTMIILLKNVLKEKYRTLIFDIKREKKIMKILILK